MWGETSLKSADDAYLKGDFSKAIDGYRELLRADPKNYEATWKLARAINDQAIGMKRSKEQKERFVEAQQLAEQATKLNPKDSKGFLYLSIAEGKVALFEGGKTKVQLGKKVKTHAEKAIELNPGEDLAYHVLGIWHREMATLNPILKAFAQWFYGKLPDASLDSSVENLKKATELNAKGVANYVELGVTYMEMKKWPEAKTAFEKALSIGKQYPADESYLRQAKQELEKVKRRM